MTIPHKLSVLRTLAAERNWLRRRVEALLEQHRVLEERYTALVDRLHQMQRDGYRPASEVPVGPTPDPLPDAVLEAISARAIDRDTAREMEQWARGRLAAGEEPGAVAQQVWRGEDGL